MGIDGLNGQQNIKSVATAKASATANAQATAESTTQVLQDELTGANRKQQEVQNETLTPNERKAWIKDYQAAHGCSRKEAKAAFEQEFGELDKMSRKDAKAWVKDYMSQNGCTKKEAKEAFKEEFGYDMPLSTGARIVRSALLAPVGAVFGGLSISMNTAAALDIVGGGKLGIKKFVTGQGNNDAAYVRKDNVEQ